MLLRGLMAATLIGFASASANAMTYTLDPNHTQVQFIWNHYGFTDLTGQFGKIEGTLEFDAADPTRSSVSATIAMQSVHSNIEKLDGKLVSSDYFDVEKYPTATFKSTKVEKGATPDRLSVTGDLTLHGVTKPVTLDVTLIKVGTNPRTHLPTVGFSGNATVSRSQFGLGKFVPQVADEIYIQIGAQAVESQAYSKYLKEKEAADAAEKVAEQNK